MARTLYLHAVSRGGMFNLMDAARTELGLDVYQADLAYIGLEIQFFREHI